MKKLPLKLSRRLSWLALLIPLIAALALPSLAQERKPGAGPGNRPPREQKGGGGGGPRIQKPRISDTVKANIYADNWFKMYLNGNLVAVDSISFIPHNVVSVDILPEYPLTIAILARDNADSETGMEYDNTNIGDGGFILKFGDGTVSNATWKAKCFSTGPLNGDTQNPRTMETPLPENWFAPDFDDRAWSSATVHSQEAVRPKEPFFEYDFAGAEWIWTEDLALDNLVVFRVTIPAPPNGSPLPPAWPRGHIDAAEKKVVN